MLEPFRQVAERTHMVPIPDHGCFAPNELVAIAASLGMEADARDDVAAAIGSIPTNARILIFGSLYLAGAVLAANDELPD